jgi:hypothetical protein
VRPTCNSTSACTDRTCKKEDPQPVKHGSCGANKMASSAYCYLSGILHCKPDLKSAIKIVSWINILVLWNVMLCSLVDRYLPTFHRNYWPHLQGRSHLSWQGQCIPLKYWYLSTRLYGVTSQNIVIITFTYVRMSIFRDTSQRVCGKNKQHTSEPLHTV